MPTFEREERFSRDFGNLTPSQQRAFLTAVRLFVEGLRESHFHPKLRIKRVQGTRDVWEITWAADGRATFRYGTSIRSGHQHIIWRRIGTHDIFSRP